MTANIAARLLAELDSPPGEPLRVFGRPRQQRSRMVTVPPVPEPPKLSRHELTVLRGVARGCTEPEQAADLDLPESKVKATRARLLRKFGARNAANLVAAAYQLGVLG